MNDIYVYIITALLPLSAFMLVLQVNPYNALVIQGILGAVASLVFAVLGAADVALTQALMGTLLAITLYAIAVRSSLVLRLGVLKDGTTEELETDFQQLINELRAIFAKYYLRLELVVYSNNQALERALTDKDVHAICTELPPSEDEQKGLAYHTVTRVQRIYEIIQADISSPMTILTYVNLLDSGEKH
ncbi:DUF4040 domain-containing protein [Chrysosporum bergii ANA360D]|jgi:putative multicomponent Na+:H+ antiporter subunit B|uniref:DUF4040 domain-containing protein n=1 Tax=Chrysosporum bergii ANA360D TaxID=617107 RepID=A0AA43GPA0_9CYAN|nr:DUF4040 domain-containing protein [Chrysosporum bergii]MDH6059330.1 DUF4040 domain-containing protein [Chrysosporum bergii ANA360D]